MTTWKAIGIFLLVARSFASRVARIDLVGRSLPMMEPGSVKGKGSQSVVGDLDSFHRCSDARLLVEGNRLRESADEERYIEFISKLLRECPALAKQILVTRRDKINICIETLILLLLACIGALLPDKLAPWTHGGEKANYDQVNENHADETLIELRRVVAEGQTVTALVEAKARQEFTRIALVDGIDGNTLTYRQLVDNVQKLAGALAVASMGAGDVVAVFLPPSPALVVALLAATKQCCVWCTLDFETPEPRLKTLVDISGARLGFWPASQDPVDAISHLVAWPLGVFGNIVSEIPPAPIPRDGFPIVCAPDTAAIFFTSGSSGVPKGVMYSGSMLVHGVLSMKRLCDMGPSSVALLKTPPIWAVLEWEAFPALVAGGSIVCDMRPQKNLRKLADILVEHRITTLMSSAPVMKALCEGSLVQSNVLLDTVASGLQHIVNVGGALPLDVAVLAQSFLPNTLIHNVYGCTECCCTEWTYQHGSSPTEGNAPAGRPQLEVQIYIVDNELRRLPPGEVGEVLVGSKFNALGYLGDTDLSNDRFIENPWGQGQTLYKTGDLGTLVLGKGGREEHVLEIRGRADRQLNISGVRVAPEEIETTILAVNGVLEVAVVQGGKSIVAFFRGSGKDLQQTVKEHCTKCLYSRMCPEVYLELDEFPKLRNGKVDLETLTARANDEIGASLVEVVDSLGLMKNVDKTKLVEMDAMAAMRGIAICFVVNFHWAGYASITSSGQELPRWLGLFIDGTLRSQWSMLAFVVMSARTDRDMIEDRRPGWMKENLFMFSLYLFFGWPLPYLLQWVNHILGNNAIVNAGHRWYIAFWIVCRCLSVVLLPMDRCLARAGHAGTVAKGILVLCCYYIGMTRVPQPELHFSGYASSLDLFYWSFASKDGTIWHPAFKTWMYCVYIGAFLFNRELASFIWSLWPKRLGAVFPLSLFICSALFLRASDGAVWTPEALTKELPIDLVLLCSLMTWLYMLAQGPWLKRFRLRELGKASLGTYVFHFFFSGYIASTWQAGFIQVGNIFVVPPEIDSMAWIQPYAGGVGQLFVWMAYPVIFCVTFGNLFQQAYLRCYEAVVKGLLKICSIAVVTWRTAM